MGIKNNKRAWMRILEATISVLIVAGVMVTLYAGGEARDSPTIRSEAIHQLQNQILSELVSLDNLRNHILGSSDTDLRLLEIYVADRIPKHLGGSLRVCDLGDPCNLNSTIFTSTYNLESFVEEKIVSANYSHYDKPRKVRLFVWIK
jgi:hypothetical protein